MALGMWSLPPSPRWLALRAVDAAAADGGDHGVAAVASATEKQGASEANSEGNSTETPLLAGGSGDVEGFEDGTKSAALRREAVAALRRLRGLRAGEDDGGEAEREVAVMVATCVREREGVGGAEQGWSQLVTGTNGRALLIGCGLVFFQQVTGQPSVLYYAASILQDAGFSAAADATKVSVVLGLFKLGMTGVAVATVDKWGRRPLLLVGVSGLVASLVGLGTFYQLGADIPSLSVLALLAFVGCYQVSFGPIAWLMVSEVFPLGVRGRAQSVATLLNFATNAVVTFAFPPIEAALGQAGTFYAFGAIGVGALAFIYTQVPETKGLELEEIEAKLAGGQL
eukprot:TRINITY_DN31201_c0_g1_i1.p1 TRINITY_DN31201_c0_g1~~TRINITY_DN31201_c0_g1_i1.p1  ORF type:complete len:372 (-),score=7.62 TRINITY_DN31201_c0_g1_i1:93-1115(-)